MVFDLTLRLPSTRRQPWRSLVVPTLQTLVAAPVSPVSLEAEAEELVAQAQVLEAVKVAGRCDGEEECHPPERGHTPNQKG